MSNTTLPPGIRAHTLKDGTETYEARVNRRSAKPVTKRFTTAKAAQSWKLSIEALIDGGIDPTTVIPKKSIGVSNTSSAESMTVEKAIANYLRYRAKSHNKLPSNQITNYERVADDWGNFLLSDLRNEDLANYITELLLTPLKYEIKRIEKGVARPEPKTYARATVRKLLYAMKVAIEWQAKNSDLKLNPFLFDFERGVVPAAWAGHRTRRLNPGEEDRLYAAGITRCDDSTYTPDDWRALIGFALETAMRQQELAFAEWKQVSADRLQLEIPAEHTKTKKPRIVLLSKRAREILEAQRKSCPDSATRIFYQFTSAGSICDSFAKLTDRAGISGLTFHDLRHEGTSRLCESGQLSQLALMQMTSHRSLTTFMGYVHLITKNTGLRLD